MSGSIRVAVASGKGGSGKTTIATSLAVALAETGQEKVRAENVNTVDLAVRLGLDRSEFKECLDSHAVAARVAEDLREAQERGMRGTPSFLIGDQLFLGRIPEAEVERLLNNAATKAMPK